MKHTLATAAAVTSAALLLSGCGTDAQATDTAATTTTTTAATAAVADTDIDGEALGDHVHNLAFAGDRLLLGTHDGLFTQRGTAEPTRVAGDRFDVMGFAVAGSTWLASGHPGPDMQAPHNLGLLTSADNGRTWTARSLSGKADFHRLTAYGDVIMGINSGDSHLLRSTDAGRTWTDFGVTGIFDLVLVDGDTIVGTTERGPVRSTDGGTTFTQIPDVSLLALLANTGSRLLGADINGAVQASDDGGLTWTTVGTLPGQPTAFAASGTNVAALVDTTVYLSTDGGASFHRHLINVGGH